MARIGLYKTEVKKARDAVLAQGRHPSVDAVRIALGNTGSKTTIHKYLKELEEEEGGAGGRKASISEALQDLVERLAAQMQDEANTQIDALRTEHAHNERQHAETLATTRQEMAQVHAQLQRVETALQQERESHRGTRETLQQETIARHTSEQQVADLKERLAENEAHRVSLEEKHQHAREALEHYRASVKEQREQDARRHEQQVQQLQAEMRQLQQSLVVKQDDVTRLNQEGAQLVANLSHAKNALHEEKSRVHQIEQLLQRLPAVEQRCKALEQDVAEKALLAHEFKGQLELTTQRAVESDQKAHALELALAVAQAKLESQKALGEELRAFMAADKVDGKVPSMARDKKANAVSTQKG